LPSPLLSAPNTAGAFQLPSPRCVVLIQNSSEAVPLSHGLIFPANSMRLVGRSKTAALPSEAVADSSVSVTST